MTSRVTTSAGWPQYVERRVTQRPAKNISPARCDSPLPGSSPVDQLKLALAAEHSSATFSLAKDPLFGISSRNISLRLTPLVFTRLIKIIL